MTTLPPTHEAATVWPMLTKDELEALAASIGEQGLIYPLTDWYDENGERWLLDGRNRAAACSIIGIDPEWETYKGNDPVNYILAANAHRRHITPSQRAIAVASMVSKIAQQDAADIGGVSRRLVISAVFVRDHAPDLAEAVLAGTIKVSAAETEARRREAIHAADNERLERLATQSPELAELVTDGDMTLADAEEKATDKETAHSAHTRQLVLNIVELCTRLMRALEALDVDNLTDDERRQVVSAFDHVSERWSERKRE